MNEAALEHKLVALLRFVAENEGASLARAAKGLQLRQSELLRCLSLLGDAPALGGLGLVELREDGGRRQLALSERGRNWLEQQA